MSTVNAVHLMFTLHELRSPLALNLHQVARVGGLDHRSNPAGDVMPNPCSVCSHPNRADIDRRLAQQVVNVSALSREFGLNRNAVTAHRTHHLPDFLVALTAQAELPGDQVLNAELQRLYLTTLDALARAEAGTLVLVGKVEGELRYERMWSPTAVARLLSEARKGLGMISALAAQREQIAPPDHENRKLDAAIEHALARFEERQQLQLEAADPHITDAIIVNQVDQVDVVDQVDRVSGVALADPHTYAGVDAGEGAGVLPRLAEDPFTDRPPENDGSTKEQDDFPQYIEGMTPDHARSAQNDTEAQMRAAELFLAGLPKEVRAHIAEVIDQAKSNDVLNPETLRRPWPGNPAASAEERAAEGWPTVAPLASPLDHPSGANPATDRSSRPHQGRRQAAGSDPNLPPGRK